MAIKKELFYIFENSPSAKHIWLQLEKKKVSPPPPPPNQNGVTFSRKGFEQNNLAGVFRHLLSNLCVKMRLIRPVMHE